MESIYDYGARAGFWRLHRLFTGRALPVTIFGVASALARSPEQVAAMQAAGWEIASHGLKWVEHRDMPEAEERAAIAEAIRLHTEVTGQSPRGWYTGRCSTNTVRLVAETGAFDWISDAYDDDLPHWMEIGPRDQLILPYTLEANDMRFATAPGWVTGRDFEDYLTDAFDTLYAEGQAGAPKMLSIGLHCRLVGRPGKIAGLMRFLDHAMAHDGVWFATRGTSRGIGQRSIPITAARAPQPWTATPSSPCSAASMNIPLGWPKPRMAWNWAPPMTAPWGLRMPWRARFGPAATTRGCRCFARTRTLRANWPAPSG